VRWRSDGKEIFYLALDGQLMAVPIQIDPDGQSLRPGTPVPLFTPPLAFGVVHPVQRQQYVHRPTAVDSSWTPPLSREHVGD
jgi:hypothetical protein